MATLRLKIVDSKFVSHNGVEIETFEERYVNANGWEVTLSEVGKLECVALRYYDGILHLVKFKVQKGYARLILKVGEKRAKVLKSFKLESWPADVILGLPGGFIDSRRPYIRREKFQRFLDEHDISSVRNESPNGTYLLIREAKNGKFIYYETIETDGNAKLVQEDDKNGLYRYEIIDASWAIKTVEKEGSRIRVLYTMDNPEEIMNLPKN